MQLKKTRQGPRNIRRQLATATCTLLAGASHAGGLIASGDNWKIDSALLIYLITHNPQPVLTASLA